MIKFTLPVFIARWLFPGMVEELDGRAIVHGKANTSRRWLGGLIEVQASAEIARP